MRFSIPVCVGKSTNSHRITIIIRGIEEILYWEKKNIDSSNYFGSSHIGVSEGSCSCLYTGVSTLCHNVSRAGQNEVTRWKSHSVYYGSSEISNTLFYFCINISKINNYIKAEGNYISTEIASLYYDLIFQSLHTELSLEWYNSLCFPFCTATLQSEKFGTVSLSSSKHFILVNLMKWV